jgi:hypothetical protein
VSAREIEAALINALRELPAGESLETAVSADGGTELTASEESLVEQHLERVTVRKDLIGVRVVDAETNVSRTITVPWSSKCIDRKRQTVIPKDLQLLAP